MALLERFFGPKADPDKDRLRPLYDAIVQKARAAEWYEDGGVADSVDGRFEMVAAMLSLVLLRLESEAGQEANNVHLTEIFVDDMDSQLREIGIGDMIVGKQIGKMMSALGGRLGAYREGLGNDASLRSAITRNVFGNEAPSDENVAYLASRFEAESAKLAATPVEALIAGGEGW